MNAHLSAAFMFNSKILIKFNHCATCWNIHSSVGKWRGFTHKYKEAFSDVVVFIDEHHKYMFDKMYVVSAPQVFYKQ